jgi:membrane protease YdiL (CAAX protease family)
MFISQGFTKENPFWKYLIGSLLVIIASTIGQVPLFIFTFIKSATLPEGTSTNFYKLFDSNLLLFLMLISFVFGLLGLYLVVKKYHNQSFISIITSRFKVDWHRFFVSFTIWAIISIIMILGQFLAAPEHIKVQFQLYPFLILFLISVVLIPIQTSMEELLFRGYLMQGFYNLSQNKWFPLVMTSLLFGLLHIANPEIEKLGYSILIYYIGTGFFLGIITLMDEGTELALGFHAANNLIAALLITSDFTVFQTHSVFKDYSEPNLNLEAFFPVFVLFPLLIYVFSKIYKWKNWNEKLI